VWSVFHFSRTISCIHIEYEGRPAHLRFEESLDSRVCLTLVVIVIHVCFRAENRACYECVALTSRIIVRLVRCRLLDVRFAVLPLRQTILDSRTCTTYVCRSLFEHSALNVGSICARAMRHRQSKPALCSIVTTYPTIQHQAAPRC
jgi:hypothetical protein